jgi:hypothetical protein
MPASLFPQESRASERAGADFSACRTWRYALWRFWGAGRRTIAFVGLNPSTADETQDDPTIRRCLGFARRWGFDGLYMLNAYAFRATDPRIMRAAPDPVGPANDEALAYRTTHCERIVVCWGVHADPARVRRILAPGVLGDRTVHCLGRTKDGAPKHPLYLPAATDPVVFHVPVATDPA